MTLRSYLVTLAVRDCYYTLLQATDESAAVAQAQQLYDDAGEEAFDFSLTDGGIDSIEAKEIC